MQVTKKVEVAVTLVLNKEETDWLHMVMQNPLHGQPQVCDESPLDNEMRRRFWLATEVGQ